MEGAEFLVRGRVQGVGFRPAVWRLARECGLSGDVRNDAAGVLIRVTGTGSSIAHFLVRLRREPPPLARIERIEQRRGAKTHASGFRIVASTGGDARTEIAPDAAICAECTREVLDPTQRRHRYAFANCTHCGPRLSIVRRIPYDRAHDHDGALRAVRCLPERIRGTLGSPLPRRGDRLPRLRPAPERRRRHRGDIAAERTGRRAEGHRRLSARVRCNE